MENKENKVLVTTDKYLQESSGFDCSVDESIDSKHRSCFYRTAWTETAPSDAGVDPHVGDRFGKLALSDTGIFRREMQVLSTCVSSGYPVACVIGGGYADDLK